MTGRRAGSRRPQGKGHKTPTLRPPREGLFRDIVMAPDRDSVPEARPVLSIAGDEPQDFQAEVQARRVEEYGLSRRGIDYGRVVELEREGLVGPRPRRRRRETIEFERWIAGSPIFLSGAADGVLPNLASNDPGALLARLREPGGLASYVETRTRALEPKFRVTGEAPLFDPERDFERIGLQAEGADDLWLKTGRLSLHAEDHSLRMRASFGVEGDDDASADEARHGLVGEMARALFPGASALAGLEDVHAKLERFAGGPTFGTQHIAYWNAPGGGARMHHDAFDVPEDAPQQCGVLYAQLTGRTLWLTLSIEDLTERVREVVRWIQDGDMPWLPTAFGSDWSPMQGQSGSRATLLHELALPGCGVFGPLIETPEFTACLADAGHALVLRPGDVLLLPNHGLARTAMHSVFCASKKPGFALSVALRREG